LKKGHNLELDELRSFCRESIAGYKCPKSLLIRNQPLPRSAAGKVLKRELREPYWVDRTRTI
jgi:long-chain acyl-CoA synthetase